MPEDVKITAAEFLANIVEDAHKALHADAAIGRELRKAFGGELLKALASQNPDDMVFFAARVLVGHTINHGLSTGTTPGSVIACTDFLIDETPHGDWQVIITPYDQELADLAAEASAQAKPDGTVH